MLPFKNLVKVATKCLPQMINVIVQCLVVASHFTAVCRNTARGGERRVRGEERQWRRWGRAGPTTRASCPPPAWPPAWALLGREEGGRRWKISNKMSSHRQQHWCSLWRCLICGLSRNSFRQNAGPLLPATWNLPETCWLHPTKTPNRGIITRTYPDNWVFLLL